MERPDSEFAAFVRDSAKRALDTVAQRTKDLEKPVRAVVRGWSKLEDAAKDSLINELITSWMTNEEEPPKRAVKRHDPAKIAKTLPKKPTKKKKSAPSKKK
jgi:hypothetical protein